VVVSEGRLLVGGCTVAGFLGEYLWKLTGGNDSQEGRGRGEVDDLLLVAHEKAV